MNIRVQKIPREIQRYSTVGDWWWAANGTLEVRVTDMGDDDYENLVAVHEIVEAILCKKRNITEAEVTSFDMAFETARLSGNFDEPGDVKTAPYHKEHVFATRIEMLLARELEVVWEDYDDKVNSL